MHGKKNIKLGRLWY